MNRLRLSLGLLSMSLILGIHVLHAQTDSVTTTSVATLESLFTDLFPDHCSTITNLQAIGDAAGRGWFQTNTEPFGKAVGIVFSSGNVEDLDEPVLGQIPISGYLESPGDPDLALLTDHAVMDVSGMRFDLTPDTDSLIIRYQFASEEYPAYNCTPWVDVFGIFLSGPGIDGPFSGGAINLATLAVNGDTVPVGINSINTGILGTQPNANLIYCQPPVGSIDLSDLYVANPDETQHPLNGLTKILTTRASVIPGETYHLKIVIGDAVDDVYDSALFLHGINVCDTPRLAPQARFAITQVKEDTVFFRNESLYGVDFHWDFGDGTTAHQQDPGFHIYPGPGNYPVSLVVSNHCCSDTLQLNAPVFQAPVLQNTFLRPVICESLGSITLDVLCSTPVQYSWSTGDTTSTPNLANLAEGTYTVIATNTAGEFSTFGPFQVTQVNDSQYDPVDTIVVPSCIDPPIGAIAIQPAGPAQQFTYRWSHAPNWPWPTVDELPPGAYQVTITDPDGCQEILDLDIPNHGPTITSLSTEPPLCAGDNSGTLEIMVEGPHDPFTVDVLNQTTAKLKFPPYQLNAGAYRVFVQDDLGCKTTETFQLIDPPAIKIALFTGMGLDNQITASVQPSQGNPPYSFLWSDGSTQSVRTDLTPGSYGLTVTDMIGCSTQLPIPIGPTPGETVDHGGLTMEVVLELRLLRLSGPDSKAGHQISIHDMQGRLISQLIIPAGQSQMPLPALPSAVYRLAVRQKGLAILTWLP